ncbi:MAG: DUF4190 domain-containing protein [Kutzneria sp.]|nr:DUF4190 domain-containing protein [Kutzneria sp.]
MSTPQYPPPPPPPGQPYPYGGQSTQPRNGLGTAGFVVGLIGFLLSLIPVIGLAAWPLVVVGLVLSIIGLNRAVKGVANNKALTIAGLVLSILGLLACIAYTVVTLVVGKKVVDEANKTVTISYEVTGDAPDADVTYTTFSNNNPDPKQESHVTLPWHRDEQATGLVKGGSLSASTGEQGGTVTCKLTIDGKVAKTNTVTSTFQTATCTDL